jgi:hypothetical protein
MAAVPAIAAMRGFDERHAGHERAKYGDSGERCP